MTNILENKRMKEMINSEDAWVLVIYRVSQKKNEAVFIFQISQQPRIGFSNRFFSPEN